MVRLARYALIDVWVTSSHGWAFTFGRARGGDLALAVLKANDRVPRVEPIRSACLQPSQLMASQPTV